METILQGGRKGFKLASSSLHASVSIIDIQELKIVQLLLECAYFIHCPQAQKLERNSSE
jgi:hypothetical protein